MSLNRVIGRDNKIPWHLPEDFRWFKKCTQGQVVLMGRRTFESLGKPLPNRTNVVVSRTASFEGVEMLRDLADFDESRYAPRDVWLIGGAELYTTLLPSCSDLFLSVVNRTVEGDAYLPPFEEQFELVDVPLETADFRVLHYLRKAF